MSGAAIDGPHAEDATGACCALETGRPSTGSEHPSAARFARADRAAHATALIPGARAEVGTDRPFLPADGEGPRRFVALKSCRMDTVAVTNARFAQFVAKTGYVTEAERYGWSFVFHKHVIGDAESLQRPVEAEWWRRVDGAGWSAPEGPGSTVDGRLDHPVVHVSLRDAAAFASWAGGRLPSEAEWEHAARGGQRSVVYPWGDEEPGENGPHPCNIWQGRFPHFDTAADGYAGTAPARSFAPNPYGLYNMCGNVWEWCTDLFRIRSLKQSARAINDAAIRESRHVLKGGSFLCHRSYCYRYRIAARIGNPPDSSASHIGFRLVYDLER